MSTFERKMQDLLVIVAASVAGIFSVLVGDIIDSSMHWQLPSWVTWALPLSVWLASIVTGKIILMLKAKGRA